MGDGVCGVESLVQLWPFSVEASKFQCEDRAGVNRELW